MNRNSKVERVYPIGDNFKNLRLSDEIIDIPEELVFDQSFMQKIKYLQFIEIEQSYRIYFALMKEINTVTVEEAMQHLEKAKLATLGEIKAAIEGDK